MTFRLEGFTIRGFGPFDRGFSVDLSALSPSDRIVAICGENGAGKTTALELCTAGAMFRETPTRGSLVDLATARDAFLESRFVNGQAWTVRHMVDAVSRKSETVVLDADGAPALPDSKVSSFDAWAAKNLPSPAVFYATVLTPQGAGGFAGAKPAARKDVLLSILGPETEQLEADAAHAREQLKAAKLTLATLEARIADERSRGGDVDALTAELVERRQAVVALTSQLEQARADLASAEQDARNVAAAKQAAVAWEQQCNALTESHRVAREALAQLEAKVRNNRGVLADAKAIRAAAERLPAVRALISKTMIAMAAAYQQIQGHSSAAAEAARAEGLARQRANAAKQRLEKASRAQGGTVKLTELRERLSKAEYAVADARESLERLRGKRLSGAEERLDAAIGTLEVIAGGEEDPAGLAQERLDRNQQEVQEARNLPEEIAAYERLLREHECAVTVLARDVRTCELNAEAAKDLQPAAQELEIAQAALEDADTRRRREGEAASIATSEHEEIGKTLSALQVELLGVEPIAAKSGPLDKAETRLAELEPQVAAAKAEVARLDVALADMGPMPAWPGEPDVDGARAAATEAEQQLALARDAAARTEQQLKQAVLSRHRVLDLEEQRTAAEAELSDWTRLAADLGKDGLQAMVIDGAIPEINELTNELLHAAFGPRFTVEVRTQTADAKGKRLLETLDVFVIDTGTDQHKGREGLIETFSGGEKTILAEALSLALTRLACRLSGAERPTLIRDESAGQLSEGNAPIWMAMLRRAADLIGVDRILFVNHDRQTWELADARIEVRS